jgi:hypothetical protein
VNRIVAYKTVITESGLKLKNENKRVKREVEIGREKREGKVISNASEQINR